MKTRRLLAILAFILSGMLTSCEYEYVIPDVPVIDPTVPIKFSEEIAPIFSNNNNCIACHKTGATSPDLTADRAYNSIVPALINTADAEASQIYWHAHPLSTTHAWKKYKTAEAALLLEWIKQGAKNN
ncbi:MAG: hypothetical protein CVT92_04120 [Bacteroidetes bacterium HGW-Bacteroidetes-1]|jgi:hypothetical protein|nr:MAG: hypothetical protein CVT92_04120 [Bacteroidetes bacterium HGW-Bacteroidetes-1]